MRLLYVFLPILAVRLASVFVVQTYYVPDEYWQSLEVAHKLTFGYGYLTWEWVQGIRSYVYPLLIAGLYKILALLQLDSAHLLVLLPRILQALLSAYSDYRFFVWTGKRKWALFLILVPWFWFYTGSRTLANTLEASLTTIALSYFPWYGESTGYLWPAAICCFLRPTVAVIWLPLSLYHLRKSRQNVLELILKRFVLIGHIHQNVTMRFLTCEPNLEKKEQYKDEADRFFEDPVHWINSHIPVHPLTALPTHVVMFDPLAENISVFLRNYRLLHRIEHAEVIRLEGSQALVDEWSQALGAQSPNLASLLQHRQSRTGRSILVYQRLKKGEENAFNQKDQEQDVHDHPPLEDLPLANENLFN
uniref:Mannosyltransferase n=1 Tax=Drosophila rhopaloa TaxID=1041015 RepID=A0A6P4ELS6_DRORH